MITLCKNLFAKFKKLNKVKKALVFLLLMLVIAIPSYLLYKNGKADEEEIQTATVSKGNLVNSITLSGQIESSSLISVSTKASGVVDKVYIVDGQQVKAGDKLAEITLDSEGLNSQASAWAKYLSAKKSVELAQASQLSSQASMFGDWDQYIKKTEDDNYEDPNSTYRALPEFQILEKEWLASELTYKTQATSIQSAQASKSEAWYNYMLYQATITAPVDGAVVGLNIAEGLTISYSEGNAGGAASQTVATLKTEGKPIASFSVTEVDINKIQSGQEAKVTLDSFTDETYIGKVVAIDRIGSITNGVTQYGVLISIETESQDILPNMAASAEIVLDSRENVLFVPASAVMKRGEKSMVRVRENENIKPVEVETGLETDVYIEIVSGLNEGAEVVTSELTLTNGAGTDQSQPPAGGIFPVGGGTGTGMRIPH